MRRNFIDYTYFMSSQVIFLAIFTSILLFFDTFNWFYGSLFILLGLFFLIPIIHLKYMIKKTNKTPFFVVEREPKKFTSKKYLWYVFLWAIPFALQYFDKLNDFMEQYFQIYYLPYFIVVVLSIYFLLDNNHYEYWIFENFVFVNILKYKVFEVNNKEVNTLQVFTRKNIKKSEKINIKHITGGLYYY